MIYGSNRNLSGKDVIYMRSRSDHFFGRYCPDTESVRKTCFWKKRMSLNGHISRTVRFKCRFFCRNRLSMRSLRGSGFFDPERYASDRKIFHFQKMRGVVFVRICAYFHLFTLRLFSERNHITNIDILYINRSGIYRGIPWGHFWLRPMKCPEATVRNPDAIGEKPAKMAFFRRFSIKFRALKGWYQLDILIQGKGT